MARERARRRAEREREAAIQAAARAEEAERRERRAARRQAVRSLVPQPQTRRGRPAGVLAERRRRQRGATVALLVALNVLVWIFTDGWAAPAMALIVSLLAAPVLHTMLFRRR